MPLYMSQTYATNETYMQPYARLCSLFLVSVLMYTVTVITVSASGLQVALTVTLKDDAVQVRVCNQTTGGGGRI
jgi:hypothetical protein